MNLIEVKSRLSHYRNFPFREHQAEAIEYILNSEKRFCFLEAPTGCHHPDQKLLMYDGTIKAAKDIQYFDKLMGPDGSQREVQYITYGIAMLYIINPIKGKPFIVNGEHILVLKKTNEGATNRKSIKRNGMIKEVTVNEYLKWSSNQKHIYKLFRVPIKEFPYQSFLPIEPYMIGLLLGDGSINNQIGITTIDKEIVDYVYSYAKYYDLSIRPYGITYYFQKNQDNTWIGSNQNNLQIELVKIGLYGHKSGTKFIPQIYKTAKLSERLELLAGLIDTDGSLAKYPMYDYVSKSEQLAEDVAFLARSVGLSAYVNPCKKSCQNGRSGIYFRVSICGDVNIIPCKVKRKQATVRKQIKSVLVTGFSLKEYGEGRYIGFSVEGDRRYLLDDFTVTHNSGKSLIAMVSGMAMGGTTYSVHSKILQTQITQDFPEAQSLFGRANYPCAVDNDLNCDECFHTQLHPCSYKKSDCEYEKAKKKCLGARLQILNYDYLLSEINYVGRFSGSPFNIIDEADNLESTLVNFVTLTFTSYALGRLGLAHEADNLKKTSKNTQNLLNTWITFAQSARVRAGSIINALTKTIDKFTTHPTPEQAKVIKEKVRVTRLFEKIELFLHNVNSSWVLDDAQQDKYIFRPLWLTPELAETFLWKHAKRWVLMSASFLPIHLECKRLGIPIDEVDYLCLPSTFPISRRPIHIETVANLTAKTMDIETPKLITRISEIIDSHPGEKGLIHAVSYKLANAIMDNIDSPRLIIHNTKDRQEVLTRFIESPLPLVLISPSMERGVSFEMDLCRFIIVAKAPFLYLGDRIVSARVYGSKLGSEWYAATMLLTVLQMTGRAMRSADDSCVSYILDEQFKRVYQQRPLFVPEWWKEAVDF